VAAVLLADEAEDTDPVAAAIVRLAADARTHLRTAHTMFQHMTMTGFADRARLALDLLRPGVAGPASCARP
jgi:hypothetical protein